MCVVLHAFAMFLQEQRESKSKSKKHKRHKQQVPQQVAGASSASTSGSGGARRMHLNEFVAREEVMYEDEHGVRHKTLEAAGPHAVPV